MLIHWLRRESKGKRSLWGLVQVKGKKLWINWESTGGTLKTDKGKKKLLLIKANARYIQVLRLNS